MFGYSRFRRFCGRRVLSPIVGSAVETTAAAPLPLSLNTAYAIER